MKSNKILLVSLFLLAIISLGAVSAAEDATDVSIAAEATDASDDVISEPAAPAAEEISANKEANEIAAEPVKEEKTATKDDKISSSKDDVLKDYNEVKSDDYYVSVSVNNLTDAKSDRVFTLYTNKTGTYNAFVDGVAKVIGEKVDYYNYETAGSLNLNPGFHTLKVTYTPQGGTEVTAYEGTIKFCRIDIEADSISEGETGVINAILPTDATGTVTVYVEDKEGKKTTVGTFPITNGAVKIERPGITEDNNYFLLEFKTNYGDINRTAGISIIKNDPTIAATVTPTVFVVGNSATISFNSHYKYDVSIYVDDEFLGSYNDISSFTKVVSGLSVGQHKIKIIASDDHGTAFLKTFDITVNKKPTISLSLKKLKTVKKSAKKVVLQATVKVNKKAKAKVKVTFKFNGKKYTAKTNSKGIAKVTIKKSVLKKLKKGKKITYQATYSTKTVKRTIKVKK